MTYTIEAPPGMQEEEVRSILSKYGFTIYSDLTKLVDLNDPTLELEHSEDFRKMIMQAEAEIAQGAYYDWEDVCESLNKKYGNPTR